MHGKLHEAETRLNLAKLTLSRVKQSANKVAVVKAKASMAEADATLKRVKQLVDEGLSARKDMIAAEAEYDRAVAEYNFQRDITLNKELAEAQAEYRTAQTETEHIRDGLRAFDAELASNEGNEHDISTIKLRAPISGTIIERNINPGAGFESGKPLLTIANISTLWVIANVPESQMTGIKVGLPAEVKVGDETIKAQVSFVDSRLNEDTRTARVRLQIANPQQKIRVGSFVQVKFVVHSNTNNSNQIFVPSSALQYVQGKPVVFVEQKPGQFEMRRIETGPEENGVLSVLKGLTGSEKIAASGSFILKSKALREQFGEE